MKTNIDAQSNGFEYWRIPVVNSTAKPKVERPMIIGRLNSLAVHAGENIGSDDSFEEVREKLKGGLIVQISNVMNTNIEPPIAMNQKYRN